jgi:hypothetical protein
LAIRTEIGRLLEKSPKQLSSDTQLMMRERYETVFHICDHDAPNVHPLALMTMQPAENNSKGGKFEQRLEDFMAFDVLKYTGMSFKELLQWPRERVESVFEKCRQRQARDSKHQPPGLD